MDEGAHARAALWYDVFVVSIQAASGYSWDETTHLPVRKLAASVVHQRFRVNDGRRNTCLSADDVAQTTSLT